MEHYDKVDYFIGTDIRTVTGLFLDYQSAEHFSSHAGNFENSLLVSTLRHCYSNIRATKTSLNFD